ncbi:MAG: glycosyltransferase [Actinobacteria bacterium]|nr:glycosyltransferase [Actinomycetota bacterium]
MTEPTDDVVALAEQRATARIEKDFAASDRLRDEIAAAGWTVRDGPDGYELAARPPYDVLPSVSDLPDRTTEPDDRRCTVAVLVEGWPDDVRTCVEALVRHAPPDVVVVLLENGPTDAGAAVHELAQQYPGRVEEVHLERVAGWSAARQALLDADTATVHVLLDPSTVLEGDALAPVLDAFDDPSVAGAGWRGVRVKGGWREFEDAGPGEVEALLGYLFAVRRSAARQVPLPPKARFYRNADMEWSFLLREAGVGRLVVPAGKLPLRQDRHRGYHETPADYRDKESKKTYDRFLQRFRGREDLRLGSRT